MPQAVVGSMGAVSGLPRYLQLLWGLEPAGRRGPRPTRSIEEIGEAAIEVADREGLEACTMKRVAATVGLSTMALYRYVDTKDELHAVMLDLALGPPAPAAAPGDWRSGVAGWARVNAERRLAHPWMVDVARATPPLTPNHLAWTEAGLAALSQTQLSSEEKFSVLLAVDGWGAQHVRQSTQLGLVGRLEADSEAALYAVHIAQLVRPDRFPHLVQASSEALGGDPDDDFFRAEFDRGLGLLLDGVEAMIERAAAPRAQTRSGPTTPPPDTGAT